jgi:uncharacterized membrane protein YfcA
VVEIRGITETVLKKFSPACTPRGGVLGWLHHTVPMWAALCMIGAAFMGSLTGLFLSRRHDAAMNRKGMRLVLCVSAAGLLYARSPALHFISEK